MELLSSPITAPGGKCEAGSGGGQQRSPSPLAAALALAMAAQLRQRGEKYTGGTKQFHPNSWSSVWVPPELDAVLSEVLV